MISAKKARELTQESLSFNLEIELNQVEECIKQAIVAGRSAFTYDGVLSQKCREKLEQLGYKVQYGSQYNESYYTVSW